VFVASTVPKNATHCVGCTSQLPNYCDEDF